MGPIVMQMLASVCVNLIIQWQIVLIATKVWKLESPTLNLGRHTKICILTLLHCYAQSPSTMTFANWTFSAKNMTRIPNAIGISICANANRNMWFNLSTMVNLGVSVSRLYLLLMCTTQCILYWISSIYNVWKSQKKKSHFTNRVSAVSALKLK